MGPFLDQKLLFVEIEYKAQNWLMPELQSMGQDYTLVVLTVDIAAP